MKNTPPEAMELPRPVNFRTSGFGFLSSFVIRHSSFALFLLLAASAAADTILNSKHNLSANGPGQIKAVTETEVCLFCHTPHNAQPDTPLWNHAGSTASYRPYSSSTLNARVGQPTGSSKLCLSCHDGTVALGMVHSRPAGIALRNGVTTMPVGPANVGTDLSDDHPVSFTFDSALAALNGELRDPQTLNQRVRLDHNQQVQCTSCHDPHDNQYGQFLVQENTGSLLCLQCHTPEGWQGSAHGLSVRTWSGTGLNPWPRSKAKTVSANGCENCHTPHNAGTGARLLGRVVEEQNCLVCHSGTVAAKNLEPEFNKFSAHAIRRTSGVHDAGEDVLNPGTRHVTCVDCHNPHAATATPATRPNATGALAGVPGIAANGSTLKRVTREYELCFRCHADSFNRGTPTINRQHPQTNLRLAMAGSGASFHPVVAPGRNPNVPSLITPLTTGSLIYCTDCHNNNQGPNVGGTGPNGPHGSIYPPLLERNLALKDGGMESVAQYALCYKCHDQNQLLNGTGGTYAKVASLHRLHVKGVKTACTTCHDPHGAPRLTHLMNFNTDYAQASSGVLEFRDTGSFSGTCTLKCHGKDHQNTPYEK
jgi:predicted CXXCH cytochrome family protein